MSETKQKVVNETGSSKALFSKQKGKGGMIFAVAMGIIAIIGGGIFALNMLTRPQHINTGNARVTTNYITISSLTPGLLERFTLYEGRRVREGEILGWIQNGESLRSPANGIVVNTNATINQHILPMEALATIADTSNIHIQANIYETYINDLKIGQPATITIDGYGNRQFGGYVRNISRINSAELAGMTTFLNTGGTFRRITHTIPVEIAITDDVDLSYFFGASARVSILVTNDVREVNASNGASNSIITTGMVESILSRNIYATHPLRIKDVHVSEGDFVTAGQVLATLDVADIETQIAGLRANINQARQSGQISVLDTRRMLEEARTSPNIHVLSAQSALNASRIQLDSATQSKTQALTDYENRTNPQIIATESVLRAAELELQRLETEYGNMSRLYEAGVVAQRDFHQVRDALAMARNHYSDSRINHENALEFERRTLELLRTALSAAQAAYQSSRELASAAGAAAGQEISRLQAALQMAEIDNVEHMEHLLAQMERQMEEGVITAPISGTVTTDNAKAGEFALGRLFSIEDTENLRILANIREYDLSNVYVGQEVTVTAVAAGNKRHSGTITRISTRAVNVFPVEFEIEVGIIADADTNASLRIGMSAQIEIEEG